ncbi:MAG: response regulator [Nitrososphaeraceae archaeon]|nr:response regulator [Nitrososphaeraceae archaeon]MDW3604342.1 response regulator [Nitrososphaeraceae archaeon]MDW3631380.1 response regulator [Nitrososphaeraceae archaeon]
MNVSNTSNIPPRIMVVDDERDILSIVKRGLESKNRFQVETFIDAESALESLKENSGDYYDLVLTDIRMPKINGFELYRRIKESNPHMKIVFITAFEINKDEFSKVIPSVDVIDFISKPVSMSTLITKLNSILNHSN